MCGGGGGGRGVGRERRDSACVVERLTCIVASQEPIKFDRLLGKSNAQIYFFSTTSLSCKEFLVNGMTVSRISVFQYTFFSQAYGLLTFFNRFDTRARVKTISYGIENI